MRLETVEDFERVAKVFKNPESKSHEYGVKDFGYCRKCHAITEYNGDFGLEGCYLTCLKCGANFTSSQGMPGYNPIEMYAISEDDMPQSAGSEFKRLRSREAQLQFFLKLLERKKLAARKQERQARATVRRLAKIVSLASE